MPVTLQASIAFCEAIDHGAAGVAEAEQLGDLVEGLARGVVAGGAELAHRGGASTR
jgi:hypothetical protein